MLTQDQRKLISKLVDLEWESTLTEHTPAQRDKFRLEAMEIRLQLIREIGLPEFDAFMEGGRRLFASEQ